MKNKNILIISATPKSFENQTILFETIPSSFFYKFYTNNKLGLSEIYNKELTSENKNKIIVFCHDDVKIIASEDYIYKTLNYYLNEFDIVGLAGTKGPIQLKSPTAWHLMSDVKSYRGCVYHQYQNKVWATSFGEMPDRVLLIDGLFIAINTEKILEKKLLFDPIFKFHHYDLDFCLSANKLKLKIGVVNIPVIHFGLGNSMLSNEWKESDKIFLKKWSNL